MITSFTPLDERKRATLILVCSELGLSSNEFEQIQYQAHALRNFDANERDKLKSPKEQCQSIEKVESLAIALWEAIQDLDEVDRENLCERMPEKSIVPPCPLHRLAWDRVSQIGFEAEKLALAARDERIAAGETEPKGGRKETRTHYAHYIDCIADLVKHKISFGRGGPFERLCNAVFEAAGLPSNAQGTIRYVIQRNATSRKRRENRP